MDNRLKRFITNLLTYQLLGWMFSDQYRLTWASSSLFDKDVSVLCNLNMINLTFYFKSPFTGVAFPHYFYHENECMKTIQNAKIFTYSIPTQTCGLAIQDGYFENTIYLLKNSSIINSGDYAFKYVCQTPIYNANLRSMKNDISNNITKRSLPPQVLTVNSLMDLNENLHALSGNDSSNLMTQKISSKGLDSGTGVDFGTKFKVKSRFPKLEMKIIHGTNPLSPDKSIHTLTQTSSIVMTMNDIYSIYDFYLVNCYAQSSNEKVKLLIDHRGCPFVRGLVRQQRHAILATGEKASFIEFKVFRFPDSNKLTINCEAQICFHKCTKTQCSKKRFKRISGDYDKNRYSVSNINNKGHIETKGIVVNTKNGIELPHNDTDNIVDGKIYYDTIEAGSLENQKTIFQESQEKDSIFKDINPHNDKLNMYHHSQMSQFPLLFKDRTIRLSAGFGIPGKGANPILPSNLSSFDDISMLDPASPHYFKVLPNRNHNLGENMPAEPNFEADRKINTANYGQKHENFNLGHQSSDKSYLEKFDPLLLPDNIDDKLKMTKYTERYATNLRHFGSELSKAIKFVKQNVLSIPDANLREHEDKKFTKFNKAASSILPWVGISKQLILKGKSKSGMRKTNLNRPHLDYSSKSNVLSRPFKSKMSNDMNSYKADTLSNKIKGSDEKYTYLDIIFDKYKNFKNKSSENSLSPNDNYNITLPSLPSLQENVTLKSNERENITMAIKQFGNILSILKNQMHQNNLSLDSFNNKFSDSNIFTHAPIEIDMKSDQGKNILKTLEKFFPNINQIIRNNMIKNGRLSSTIRDKFNVKESTTTDKRNILIAKKNVNKSRLPKYTLNPLFSSTNVYNNLNNRKINQNNTSHELGELIHQPINFLSSNTDLTILKHIPTPSYQRQSVIIQKLSNKNHLKPEVQVPIKTEETNVSIYLNSTNIVRIKLAKTIIVELPTSPDNSMIKEKLTNNSNAGPTLLSNERICLKKSAIFVTSGCILILVVFGVTLAIIIKIKNAIKLKNNPEYGCHSSSTHTIKSIDLSKLNIEGSFYGNDFYDPVSQNINYERSNHPHADQKQYNYFSETNEYRYLKAQYPHVHPYSNKNIIFTK